jgi:hypothetical protein
MNPNRVLALHGFRTSGAILSMQTASLRHHTGLDCAFIDAPWPANGPPDPMIAQIYSSCSFFEWYNRTDDKVATLNQMNTSLQYLLSYIEKKGPFDGILSFSQGSAMMTMLLEYFREKGEKIPFRYVISIGGIEPSLFLDQVFSSIDLLQWRIIEGFLMIDYA